MASLEDGVRVISETLRTAPEKPGVYRMLDANGHVLYVGKAKSLKKRIVAYTLVEKLPKRLQMMVMQTTLMELVLTETESAAFLLENDLIKKLQPRYNILLKDDKSFPHILIPTDHPFPAIMKHRGARRRKGLYFGPYPQAQAVGQTIALLQRTFLLRTCRDSFFAHRSRPCLLFQIKRCSGPCCGLISEEDYAGSVREAVRALKGEASGVMSTLTRAMEEESAALNFEKAAILRDRIKALATLRLSEGGSMKGLADADVLAMARDEALACVQVFFIRGGIYCGTASFFPAQASEQEPAEVLEAFIGQFYKTHKPPKTLILPEKPPSTEAIEGALSIGIVVPKRAGPAADVLEKARTNAKEALVRHKMTLAFQEDNFRALQELLGLTEQPVRIEVYDNSHIQGAHAVGAMIVATPDGFEKKSYRRWNIKTAKTSDDFAMMQEVMSRRFAPEKTDLPVPSLVLLDGGKGQLSSVLEILSVPAIAVSKGPQRNAGREVIHLPSGEEIRLAPHDPLLFFIQRLRDEAHRFAVGSHRARRKKETLEDPVHLPHIGPKRRQSLLKFFGSFKALKDASASEIARVEGISEKIAVEIYEYLHETK